MFFTKAGFVIAWLMFATGLVFYAIVNISIWTGNLPPADDPFTRSFFASSSTFLEMIGLGVAFGIAAEISRSIAAR